jgi:transcription elongation factor GreB
LFNNRESLIKMGRYRPPVAKASPYITADGYATLDRELQSLWKRRTEVTRALSAAAAEGDRSENAEYIYRKKELAGIDRRIRYLQKRLPELSIVNQAPANNQQVFFGAWVVLEDPHGQQFTHRIVGSDEIGVDNRYISLDGPLAKALLKKHLDDEISIETPAGKRDLTLIAIGYAEPPIPK